MSTTTNLKPQSLLKNARHLIDRLVAVILPLLVLSFLTWTPLGQSLVYKLNDQFFHWAQFTQSSDIVVIELDDLSIAQLGGWPISRSHYAQLLQRLAHPEHRPRVVGMDILFLDARADDVEMSLAMQQLPVVLATHQAAATETAQSPGAAPQNSWQSPASSLSGAAGLGHVHLLFHSDGVVRGMQPWLDGMPHMSVAMAMVGQLKMNRPPPAQNEVLTRRVNPHIGFPSLSLSQALDPDFSLAMMRDKWVLVGATASSLGDMHVTPNTGLTGVPTPGVYLLANDLNNVLTDKWVSVLPRPQAFLWSAGLLMVLVVVTSAWSPAMMLRLSAVCIALTMAMTALSLVHLNWWIGALPFCLALPFAWLYWVSRKLEHTFSLMKMQLSQLPQASSKLGKKENPEPLSPEQDQPGMWRDPIDQLSSQLLSRTQDLQENFRLLNAIVLQMPDALAVFDTQGHQITANPSMVCCLLWHKQISADTFSKMTLIEVRQALGFDALQPIPPASLIQIASPEGLMHCSCTESSLLGPAVLPLHMLRIHDITPLRQQEDQRQKTLAFLSHDMRTPVAAISAVAERLIRQPVETSHINRSARDIVDYTERLMTMIDGFIDYSQATLAELNKDVHLVSNLLDDALAQVKDLAEQQKTRFVLKETDYPLAIECDAHLVVRALVNTFVNALYHGQTDGKVWVNTAMVERQAKMFAVVQIRNTVGEVPRDPMVRGFGLGLEFVRMVMARHGGTMQASWRGDLEDPSPSSNGCATLLLEFSNIQLDPEIEA